jgi:hypothetical protein
MPVEIMTDTEFKEQISLGYAAVEIANKYGTSPQAVRQRAKRLGLEFKKTPDFMLEGLDDTEDIAKSMRRINSATLDLLEQLQAVTRGDVPAETIAHLLGERGSVVSALGKVLDLYRKQVSLTWDILKEINSVKTAKKTLDEIYNILKRSHPEALRTIYEHLQAQGLMPSNRI